jgi:hypothetical protein
MRERDIEQYLVKRVKELGGEVRKIRWVGRRGAPDRLVMLQGTTVWVELKAPGRPVEVYQIREHARMRVMGQHVEVVDSIDAVERLLS